MEKKKENMISKTLAFIEEKTNIQMKIDQEMDIKNMKEKDLKRKRIKFFTVYENERWYMV